MTHSKFHNRFVLQSQAKNSELTGPSWVLCHNQKRQNKADTKFSPKSMVIVDVVVSFGCVFMALFGSYFAYEDYQESEYDEGDVDSAVSTDPRRYAPGNHEASTSNGKMSSTLNGHYKLNGQRVVKAGLDHQPKLELNS